MQKIIIILIEKGIAKEQASAVLPEGMMESRLYICSLRSWIHYCELRMSNGTQRTHGGCRKMLV